MTLLNNETDFKWYKKEQEVRNRSEEHRGEPKEYPCKVKTLFDNGDYGDYVNDHQFIYQEKVKCGGCGHTELVWADKMKEPE